MASYLNITLDTSSPQDVSVAINGGEEQTTDTQLTLEILCSDSDTTGYQMKIWSNAMYENSEDTASWEDYSSEKTITILGEPVADDTVTVYVKLRDDVWNESEVVSDSIKFYLVSPTVNITGITRVRISKIPATENDSFADRLAPRDTCVVGFTVDSDCDEAMVMVVESADANYDDSSNVLIPTDGESKITNYAAEEITEEDGLQICSLQANSQYNVFIKGADLEAASPGDGVKIVKIFARSSNGLWSA